MLAVGPDYGFGLYVHWPYCARICPYCDFNVYAAKTRETGPLVAAILADLKRHKTFLPNHPSLDSIFFGGGTPSLMQPADIGAIIDTAAATFGFSENCEISLEANPNDISSAGLSDWTKAGINRLSLGIQSLDDEALAFLGRDHDAAQARSALNQVQTVFENHSIDLIYARPGQSLADWEAELTAALALNAPHLSLYELTIEERTAFGQRASRGDLIPMEDDAQAELYEVTQTICETAGLPAYEVSNHARAPKFESRHNHIYWANGDWIGLGPGAHGRLTIDDGRVATEAARRPSDYAEMQENDHTSLSAEDILREFLPMALRPVLGLDLNRFERISGAPAKSVVLEMLVENEMATLTPERLKLTAKGRLMTDYIAGQLMPY